MLSVLSKLCAARSLNTLQYKLPPAVRPTAFARAMRAGYAALGRT